MQTFLISPVYYETAKILDFRRLGKQRVETFQILQILIAKREYPNKKIAWENHPIVHAWRGHEYQLCKYGIEICKEWIRRGYKDTMLPRFELKLTQLLCHCFGKVNLKKPKWFKNKKFFSSHRAALLFKDFNYYKQFNWKEKPKLNYVWPG